MRLMFSAVIVVLFSACGGGSSSSGQGTDFSQQSSATQDQLQGLPVEAISDVELADLKFMREEEKLARDVYQASFSAWGTSIFSNIADSEQSHIDAVLTLFDRYSLVDDASANPAGVFNDSGLQQLHDQLVGISANSLIDALMVGAEIEEIDIIDLVERSDRSDNQDIQLIYASLAKGSRNHLRSFVSRLDSLGVTYVPQHLSQSEFDAIVNSPMETGQ